MSDLIICHKLLWKKNCTSHRLKGKLVQWCPVGQRNWPSRAQCWALEWTGWLTNSRARCAPPYTLSRPMRSSIGPSWASPSDQKDATGPQMGGLTFQPVHKMHDILMATSPSGNISKQPKTIGLSFRRQPGKIISILETTPQWWAIFVYSCHVVFKCLHWCLWKVHGIFFFCTIIICCCWLISIFVPFSLFS